jgi:phage terminase Nu1 subunit (DNA packaging protein)
MLLSGWKEIASYLGCGIRTVQRWERQGLPVKRPPGGKRSRVIVDSEQIDSWVSHTSSGRGAASDVLASIKRARELRGEVRLAREDLHNKVQALRKEMAALRAKRRHALKD